MCFILQNQKNYRFSFLKPDLIPKLHLLKLYPLLSLMVTIMAIMGIVGKGQVIYSSLKMLETIITKPLFYLGFLSQTFTGQQGKGEAISLTPLYHFHPLHRHLEVNQAITAESPPQHIASSYQAQPHNKLSNLNNKLGVLYKRLQYLILLLKLSTRSNKQTCLLKVLAIYMLFVKRL